jgi:hypothetical protein
MNERIIHHEGHEEHEVEIEFFEVEFSAFLRVLRALRGNKTE